MPLPLRRWLASLKKTSEESAPETETPEEEADDEGDAGEELDEAPHSPRARRVALIRATLGGLDWRPGANAATVQNVLRWFDKFRGPPEELVQWFAKHDGSAQGGDAAYALGFREAEDKRRAILRGTDDHPGDKHFEGRTNWLPLVVLSRTSGRDLLVYEWRGAGHSGLVLRRTNHREEYEREHPIAFAEIDSSFGPPPSAPEAPELDELPDALDDMLRSLGTAITRSERTPAELNARLRCFPGGVPTELARWFGAHDGQARGARWFPPGFVPAAWRALPLDDALVLRDELLERATPLLSKMLQNPTTWIPLLVAEDSLVVVYFGSCGLRLFERRAGAFDLVPWSRMGSLSSLLEVSRLAWTAGASEPTAEYIARDLLDELAEAASGLGAPGEQHAEPSPEALAQLGGFRAPLATWFEMNTLVADGERVPSLEEALSLARERPLDRPHLPLVVGADGTWTCWVEGVGVALLTPERALVPVSADLAGWLELLIDAAHIESASREEAGSLRRNMLGAWTLDAGDLTAKDLVASLGALPWTFSRRGDSITFVEGEETALAADGYTVTVTLSPAVQDELLASLEALDGFEPVTLSWEALPDLMLVVTPRS